MPEQAEAEQYPGHLPGSRVADSEDDGKHLRIVARTPRSAEDSRIAALGETVAEVNECPPEDPVYICIYESGLDERFTDRWQNWSGAYLAFKVGNHGLQTYSFPASRLNEAEDRPQEKWAEAAQE